jgi:hypothetical protein
VAVVPQRTTTTRRFSSGALRGGSRKRGQYYFHKKRKPPQFQLENPCGEGIACANWNYSGFRFQLPSNGFLGRARQSSHANGHPKT